MGHMQTPMPIQKDNTMALGFVSKNLQPKATKSVNMRYLWMRDFSDQQQIRYFWVPGPNNDNNNYTMNFCEAHHCKKFLQILTPQNVLQAL